MDSFGEFGDDNLKSCLLLRICTFQYRKTYGMSNSQWSLLIQIIFVCQQIVDSTITKKKYSLSGQNAMAESSHLMNIDKQINCLRTLGET